MRYEIVDQARGRELRRRVLRPNLALDDPLPGDERPDAVHVAAVDDSGAVLCTCFVYPEPSPWQPDRRGSWHLRQMATAPDHRGQGLGAGVVAAAVDYIHAAGGDLLWCDARQSAVGFYLRQGFRTHGGVFTDEQHPTPHQRMYRELSGEPTASTR